MRSAEREAHVVDGDSRSNVPYRTAFEMRLDFQEASARVREQLRAWLRDKHYDLGRVDAGEPAIGPDAVLLQTTTNAVCKWQLRERRRKGVTWVSTIAVVRGKLDRQSWASINIEPTASLGIPLPPVTATPMAVRLLLDAVDAFDGEVPLRSRPTRVASTDVDDLLDLVCAEDRRLPMVIAAAPIDVNFGEWRHGIERLMHHLPGLASLYVLDPPAVQAFNDGIGETHRIGPGSVRTYLPDVDPAVAEDSVRHRVLSRRRIEEEPERAARVLAALPRQLAANSLPPAALKGLDLSVSDLTRGMSERPAVEDRSAALSEEVKILTALLGTADDTERQMKATVSRQQDELLDLTAELEVIRNEVETRDATIRALRRRLTDLNRHEEAYAPAELPPPLPTSFAELTERADELSPFVIFTGDRNIALDLDEHAAHSNWAQLAWQSLLALADYARARADGWSGGDFKYWCERPPDGARAISAGKVARDESRTVRTNTRFAAMRTLPVPRQVDRRGVVFMGAHIRLGTLATVSPRMHFHDATSADGAIYVGYIGRHLSNTATARA